MGKVFRGPTPPTPLPRTAEPVYKFYITFIMVEFEVGLVRTCCTQCRLANEYGALLSAVKNSGFSDPGSGI